LEFFRWCGSGGLALDRIGPVHVAANIEKLPKDLSRPSVKQALAAVRMLFDWLVAGQVVPSNPAASVAGRATRRKRALLAAKAAPPAAVRDLGPGGRDWRPGGSCGPRMAAFAARRFRGAGREEAVFKPVPRRA